jgi:predicted nuclease of predicted toxin-antitoxin system
VAAADLLRAADHTIWAYAKNQGFALVTADPDFYELAVSLGPPPKVIWLRSCDYPTEIAERLLRDQSIRIVEFLEDAERAVLILRP